MVSRQCGYVSDGAILLEKKCQAHIDVMQSHRLRMGESFVRAVMRVVFHARYSCNFSIYRLIKIVATCFVKEDLCTNKVHGQGNSLGRQFMTCLYVML